MKIVLTQKAATEVKRVLKEKEANSDTMLRVGISGGGCSGYEYDLSFDENFDEENDHKFEQDGIAIVVDKKSALFLDGTTLDWTDELNQRGFSFDNPNSTKGCGCGKSFSV